MKIIYSFIVFGLLSGSTSMFAQAFNLDKSFGNNGTLTTSVVDETTGCEVMAIQADGKIVVAGYSYADNNQNIVLVRYNPDGSLDNSFGVKGVVSTDINQQEDASAISILKDGKILVAGRTGDESYTDFVLVKYNDDGSLDNSFGTNGVTTTSIEDNYSTIRSLAILEDDKIIAGGSCMVGQLNNFVLARYSANGAIDVTFGNEGISVLKKDGYDGHLVKVQVLDGGKIVTTGYSQWLFDMNLIIAKFNEDGSLDDSYGTDGFVMTKWGSRDERMNAFVVQNNGKILVGGNNWNGSNDDFALAQYNEDGSIDNTFGTNGKTTTDVTNNFEEIYSLILQSDGKIIAGGGNNNGFALLRYDADGSIDNSFGVDGKILTEIEKLAYVKSLAFQSDGKLVAAGEAYIGDYPNIAVARYGEGITSSTIGTKLEGDVKVFPNPSTSQINISISKELSNASIKLLNITGQPVLQLENINGKSFSIDISAQENGLYLVEINESGNVARMKIVKN